MNTEYWVHKLNEECESKNKQFRSIGWKINDIEFEPEYDDPQDLVRNYCYQSYKEFTLCYSCKKTEKSIFLACCYL